jgi:hypothetical protein
MIENKKTAAGILIVALVALVGVVAMRYQQAQGEPQAPPVCRSNLMLIDAAVMKWAMATQQSKTNSYALSDAAILAHLEGGLPICPDGGTYTPGKTVWEVPTCSVGGHGHKLLPR